jgi:hypothetical protein
VNRPELRIGDRERDAAVAALGEHYAAGRLTKEEYDERADVAWRARTNADLAPLFVDLPAVQEPKRVTAGPTRERSSGAQGPRKSPPVLPILLLVVVVAGATGLEIWPFVLLAVVYLWLRAWMGVARMRHWAQRQDRSRAVEPWRRDRKPWC